MYLPSVPVMAPIVVPLTVTLAPGIGEPSSRAFTVPVICRVCAMITEPVISNSVINKMIFFIKKGLSFFRREYIYKNNIPDVNLRFFNLLNNLYYNPIPESTTFWI